MTRGLLPDVSGIEKVQEDDISPSLCRRIAALLDRDPTSLGIGDPFPLPWTAMLFPTLARQSDIGSDGHAGPDDNFIPPMPLPNRMFAGRSVRQTQGLRIGEHVSRRSRIVDIVSKTGRSGPLIFLTIMHEICGESGLAYTERQDVVYREGRPSGSGSRADDPLPLPQWEASFRADAVSLFRYSALTFNGHRIHYDKPYATMVEGYPGLVVNGGLTTLMLLEFARSCLGDPITAYDVRAVSPLFGDNDVLLRGARTDEGSIFWAADMLGKTAMKIKIGMTA